MTYVNFLAALGGTAGLVVILIGATWGLFKVFGEKWMTNKFDAKLKDIDHANNVLTRHLQSQLDREFDRAKRLLSKEFDVLADGWAILHEAFWRAREATSSMRIIHSFERMSDAQTEAFIEGCDLQNWQKKELREKEDAEQRDEYYKPAYEWLLYSQCMKAKTELVKIVDRNSIFMQPSIRTLFDQLQDRIANALVEYRMQIETDYNVRDHAMILMNSKASHYDELERLIHARIWSAVPAQVAPANA